jgi:hypothetical protein
MPSKYYFVGDDAYCADTQMVVPYPGNHMFQSSHDNFNYYQSSTRINIECAFGQLVRRWGIFWRKMEGSLRCINEKVMACILLHNIIREHQLQTQTIEDGVEVWIESVNPQDCAARSQLKQFASVPDGAIGTSKLRADGTVSHKITGLAEPELFSQNDCALEQPPSVTKGSSKNRCPHREMLRTQLIAHRAKRPEGSKRKRQMMQ